MTRIRVGVIGAGGIAQIEHVPNLLRLKDRFEVLGVYDPSATARGVYELKVIELAEPHFTITGKPSKSVDFARGLVIEKTIHAFARSSKEHSWVEV